MEKKRKNIRNNKGITMVALVVTIIILLILAGITLASLTGEKGIIKEARTAKELAEKAALEEQVELAIIKAEQKHRNPGIDDVIEEIKNNKVISNADQVNKENGTIRTDAGYEITGKLDDYIGKISVGEGNTTEGGNITGGGDTPTPPTPTKPSELEQAKNEGNVLDENNTTTIKDKYDNEVKIPAGFKVASDSGEDVTKGVVIEDVSAGNQTTKGSQFVWIPVGEVKYENGSKTITLDRHTFSNTGTPTGQGANVIYSYYQELANSTKENVSAIDIEAFKISANSNHGYYLGRYEAGDPRATTNRTSSSSTTTPMVCKENQYVYNYITQPQAATLARGMYSNKKVTSDLINSYAWDTAIVFIQEFSGDTDYSMQESIQDNLAKTGKAEDSATNKDVRCNIYDMAGNCVEWSTENSSRATFPYVSRGDTYYYYDLHTRERLCSAFIAVDYYSFRSILYL